MTRSRMIRTGVAVLILPLIVLAAYGSLYRATLRCAATVEINPIAGTQTCRIVPSYFVPPPFRPIDRVDEWAAMFFEPAHRVDLLMRPQMWSASISPASAELLEQFAAEDSNPE